MARQRDIGLEHVVAVQRGNLVDDGLFELDGVAADVQQGQHQRGEFVAQRDPGEAHADIGAGVGDQERGLAHIGRVVLDHRNLVIQRLDIGQQLAHFIRLFTVVQGRHQLDGLGQALQVGFQLGFHGVVEHGTSFKLLVPSLVGLQHFSKKQSPGARHPGVYYVGMAAVKKG